MRDIYSIAALIGASMLTAPAFAENLADGTYRAKFEDGCGMMVVKGSKINYAYGPCGGNATFRSAGTFDGNVIRIMDATLKVSHADANSIRGRWRLGNYSTNITFKK